MHLRKRPSQRVPSISPAPFLGTNYKRVSQQKARDFVLTDKNGLLLTVFYFKLLLLFTGVKLRLDR